MPLLALHPPLSPLTHHRDNVTAPHGRPNLRSRLHSCHAQEGEPRSPQRTCGGIGKKKKHSEIWSPDLSLLILGCFIFDKWAKLRKATINFVMSVRLSVSLSVCPSVRPPTWIKSVFYWVDFHEKFHIVSFFENLSRNFKIRINLTRIRGTLHEDQ